jgi:hypothetical protein
MSTTFTIEPFASRRRAAAAWARKSGARRFEPMRSSHWRSPIAPKGVA